MNKIFCFFAFFYFAITPLNAQRNSKNVEKYYSLVNCSELYIVENEWGKALSCYKKAFDKLNPQFNDAFNAVLVALELDDVDLSISFAELLIKKGVKINFFNQKCFKKMINSSSWQKFIIDEYPKIKQYNKMQIDSVLRNKLDNMLKMDQKYRINFNNDSMYWADTKNRIILNEIFNKVGYPSEDRVGVWMDNDTTCSNTTPIDILLTHQVDYKDSILLNNIKKFVKNGSMPSLKLVQLSNRLRHDNNMFFGIGNFAQIVYIQIRDNLYTCDENTKAEITKNRNNIYLENLTDFSKKIEYYYFKNKKFRLNIASSTSVVEPPSLEKELEFIEKNHLVLVKKLPNNARYFK